MAIQQCHRNAWNETHAKHDALVCVILQGDISEWIAPRFCPDFLHWLVVWNMNFIFPYIGNVIIQTDELIFFRGVGSTTNQDIKSGFVRLPESTWIPQWLTTWVPLPGFMTRKYQGRTTETPSAHPLVSVFDAEICSFGSLFLHLG